MVLDLPAHIPVVISIHALCEEGDIGVWYWAIIQKISIHALCEEGDDDCRGTQKSV